MVARTGGFASGISWVEVSDNANHLIIHRTVLVIKNYLAPNVNDTEVEKP